VRDAVADEEPARALHGVRQVSAQDTFTQAYIEAALWSSSDDAGEPLDENYGIEDLAAETLTQMVSDCQTFQEENEGKLAAAYLFEDVPYSPAQAGCDLWLTRNRHGAGFWDRGLGEVGDALTDAAHPLGAVYLYPGDDGRLYAA
jgi:hypothetical protein